LGVQEAQAHTVRPGPEDGPAVRQTPTIQELLTLRSIARYADVSAPALDADGTDEFAGSGSSSLSLGPRDERWDAAAADRSVRRWAGAEDAPNAKYAQAFMVKQGDGTNFGDYKLGFADAGDGEGAGLVANWSGVTAVAGVLSGARGGANITDAERAHAKSLCETYYAKARAKYDDENIKVPWDSSSSSSVAEALAYAQAGPDPAAVAVATLMWEKLQESGDACASCGHDFDVHMGDTGPCTYEECECSSYERAEEAAEEEAAGNAVADAAAEITAALAAAGSSVLAEIADRQERGVDADVVALLDEWRRENERWTWQLNAALRGGIDTVRAVRHATVLNASPPPGPTLSVTDPSGTFVLTTSTTTGGVTPSFEAVEIVPAAPNTAGEVAWSAIFAPEGKLTSDGRAFAPGSLTWRDLPLTLSAQTKTDERHVGAEVCGRIDRIWRDEESGLFRAAGVFDSGEFGQEIARLVADEVLRGISVDIVATMADVTARSNYFDEEGRWAPKSDAERPERSIVDVVYDEDDPPVMVVLEGEIGMTTVCPFPAFADARIAIGESLVASGVAAVWTVTQQAGWTTVGDDCGCDEPVIAAAVAVEVEAPPSGWFVDPQLDGPTAVTVDNDGRLFGHAALWNVCHIGLPGQCRTAPHSATGYEHFHLGEVVCAGGERLAVGQVTLDASHADRQLGAADTVAHYDHTGTAVADVRVGEDEHGIWVAGAVRPAASEEKLRTLRGAKLSGDWRRIGGGLELVALLCVNVPGFPVPRASALLAAAESGQEEVWSLVAAGIPVFEADLTDDEREQFTALAAAFEAAP
jgi:hypothetical protein